MQQLGGVEADHGLAVNDGDGRGQVADLFQLAERSRILGDVTVFEGYVVLRKELFRPSAEESPGLAIENDFFWNNPSLVLGNLATNLARLLFQTLVT